MMSQCGLYARSPRPALASWEPHLGIVRVSRHSRPLETCNASWKRDEEISSTEQPCWLYKSLVLFCCCYDLTCRMLQRVCQFVKFQRLNPLKQHQLSFKIRYFHVDWSFELNSISSVVCLLRRSQCC